MAKVIKVGKGATQYKVVIAKNALTKVNLKANPKLNTLNLWYNELLSWKDIMLPKSIVILELQHNKMTDIEWIWELKNIESLKVEFPGLEDEDLQALTWLDKLTFISVWYNKLTEKTEKAFLKFNEKGEKELK